VRCSRSFACLQVQGPLKRTTCVRAGAELQEARAGVGRFFQVVLIRSKCEPPRCWQARGPTLNACAPSCPRRSSSPKGVSPDAWRNPSSTRPSRRP